MFPVAGFKRIRYFVLSQDNRTFHGHSFIVEEEVTFLKCVHDSCVVTASHVSCMLTLCGLRASASSLTLTTPSK
jgi:hypothetical protein